MTETYKYWETIGEMIRKGDLPCMYDLYNKRDVPGEILPTITTSHTIGQCWVTLIFEYEVQDDRAIANRKHNSNE